MEKKHTGVEYSKEVRNILRSKMWAYLYQLYCDEKTGFELSEQLIIRLYNMAHKEYMAKFERGVRFEGNKKTGWDGLDDPIYRFIEDYTVYKFVVTPVLRLRKAAREKREQGGRKADLLTIYERKALPEWKKQCAVVEEMYNKTEI